MEIFVTDTYLNKKDGLDRVLVTFKWWILVVIFSTVFESHFFGFEEK